MTALQPEDYRRHVRQLEQRLERELAGLRSERRPRLSAKHTRYQAVVSEPNGIAPNGSGEITIYKNGQPTPWTPECWNVWMHGDVAADYHTEIIAEFWPDKNRFEIANQGCAAGGSHVALP